MPKVACLLKSRFSQILPMNKRKEGTIDHAMLQLFIWKWQSIYTWIVALSFNEHDSKE